MTIGRSTSTPSARAARISGAAFALGGALVVIGGVAAILTGTPVAAHDLAPLTGPGDLAGRFGQVSPLVSAAAAAVVVAAVAVMMARGRLQPLAAAIELLVLALVIDACIGGAAARIGHASDGGVLGASVASLMGGTSIVAGAIITVIGRE